MVYVDADLIQTIVKQINRIIEVKKVYAFQNQDLIFKEIAFFRVSAPTASIRVKVEE